LNDPTGNELERAAGHLKLAEAGARSGGPHWREDSEHHFRMAELLIELHNATKPNIAAQLLEEMKPLIAKLMGPPEGTYGAVPMPEGAIECPTCGGSGAIIDQ